MQRNALCSDKSVETHEQALCPVPDSQTTCNQHGGLSYISHTIMEIREWSSITGRGGSYKTEGGGGQVRFIPTNRVGGGGVCFSHARGGGGQNVLV